MTQDHQNQKKFSVVEVALTVILCISANLLGKMIASTHEIPLWLDAFGTVFAAYILGPIPGAAVGFSTNFLYGIITGTSQFYGIVNMLIGICVGLAARKSRMERYFDTMTVSGLVTILSVVISTPLNIWLSHGRTGNVWGDGVIDYMIEHNINRYLSYVMGEFYLDFLDKALTLTVLFLCIRFRRFIVHHAKHAISLLLVALLLIPTTKAEAKAKDEDDKNIDFYSYIQTIYSSDNGLPCGTANDIVDTNDGVLWIGTYAGLYRYNGREFQWMREFDSVKNVNCLYVDEEGRLWIGTNDNGLSMAINENISNVLDMDDGLPSNSIRSIVRSADGNYYVGTSGALQILNIDGGLTMVKQIPEVVYAHSLAADDAGHVAAVTASGTLFLMRDNEVVRQIMCQDKETYNCCAFGPNGHLYVGTKEDGVYEYELVEDGIKKMARYTFEGLRSINSLYFTEEGHLFACSDTGVGCLQKGGSYSKLRLNQFENSIYHMTVDYQGNFWFSSSRLGLLRLSETSFDDIFGANGIEPHIVNSNTYWNGCLIVGADDGLYEINVGQKRQIENRLTDALAGARVRCVDRDSDGNLWVSTYGKGLYLVNPDGTMTNFSSEENDYCDWVRFTKEIAPGTVVAAGDTGLAFFRNKKLTHTIPLGEDFCNSMVLTVVPTSDGKLLAGSDGDGIALVNGTVTERKITTADGLSSDVILRIVESNAGKGWYIVTSNGLCFMDNNYEVRILENFPYYNNYDLWNGPAGELFVLSSAGIYVVDEEELLSGEENIDYELLDSSRGLTSAITANSWNYMAADGKLYLSCDTGVYTVDTKDYLKLNNSYRMRLAGINLDGVEHEVERGVTFSVPSNVTRVEIMPEVINYSVEDPLVSYQLIGYDANPVICSSSQLSSVAYSNLQPGEYIFELSVLDENDTVVEQSHYTIVREHNFHDTGVFHIYLLIVGALAVAWISWYIAQRITEHQKRELERQITMGKQTIMAIARTVDAKDENTSQHSQRVSEYSVMLARELGFTEEECENLRNAALLHDIGKIGIPDSILNKPAKLTDEEYAIMKTHVTRGAEILKDFTMIDHVVEGAKYHHERYDGKGYPSGLAGEEIPIYGRIIGVADAFDAMTQNRVYRKKLDISWVLEEIERCKGSQFDPDIADIMVRLVHEGKITFDMDKIRGTKEDAQ